MLSIAALYNCNCPLCIVLIEAYRGQQWKSKQNKMVKKKMKETSNTMTIYNLPNIQKNKALLKLSSLSNGRESTVNRVLGGNTYPG